VPTVLDGVVDDADILQNERVIDMDEDIAQLETDLNRITSILMRLRKRPATSQKVEWLEDELLPRLTTLAASHTSAATTIAVASNTGQYIKVRDVLRIASVGENVAVTATSGDTIGVTRSIGSVAGASAASGVDVVIIGSAFAEGSTLGELKQTQRVAQYNYTQIQRDSFGFTNTMLASKTYGGGLIAREANKKMLEHKRRLDMTNWFGQKDLDTTGDTPISYMGGILEFITTNVTTATTITEITWETFLRTAFRHGNPNRKLAFVTPLVMSALSNFPLSSLAPTDPSLNEWGVSISKYTSGAGQTVDLVVLNDWMDYATASPQFGGMAIILDMDNIWMRPLRDTKMEPKREANDEDSKKQEYITETSLELKLEKTHAVLRGVTAYA
jgi:hypothetical protein